MQLIFIETPPQLSRSVSRRLTININCVLLFSVHIHVKFRSLHGLLEIRVEDDTLTLEVQVFTGDGYCGVGEGYGKALVSSKVAQVLSSAVLQETA